MALPFRCMQSWGKDFFGSTLACWVALFFLAGCFWTKTPQVEDRKASGPSTRTEIKFERKKIILGQKQLEVEMAESSAQISRGLMFRQNLPKNHGMLFVFRDEQIRYFWMKNTFIPLSIGFFDSDRRLLEWFDMEPVKSEMQTDVPTYQSQAAAQYALEVNQGWFEENDIKIGDVFSYVDKD